MQGSFQFVCKLQRACGGLLGDCQQYGMLTAFRGGTQFRKFGSDLNVGNIFQQDRGAGDSVAPHHGLGYLVYLVGRKYAAYDIFIAIFIEHSTIGIQVHFAGDVHHFAQCHAVMAHPFRVQLHLIFLDVAAQYGYLCHTARREQAGTYGPVGNGTQIQHRGRICCQTYNQHLAQNGRLWA